MNIADDPMMKDLIRILYGEEVLERLLRGEHVPEVNIYSYDHCNSLEEIEFEMYTRYLMKGMNEEKAAQLAKERARILWGNEEGTGEAGRTTNQ
jgi:hypothetical protein